jgi:3-isopropylmalate/(R)-2-methylmalate dehydratase small subunit
MLPIVLPSSDVDELFQDIEKNPGRTLKIDLASQKVISKNGKEYSFVVDPFRKDCLYRGLDDIGLTLIHEKKITEFENKNKLEYPWLYRAS